MYFYLGHAISDLSTNKRKTIKCVLNFVPIRKVVESYEVLRTPTQYPTLYSQKTHVA